MPVAISVCVYTNYRDWKPKSKYSVNTKKQPMNNNTQMKVNTLVKVFASYIL